MNKIYKVIWSKAKHTYVVASEIAKGHTKGETTGRGLKRLAAALLVAAALLSPNFAWAADTATVELAGTGSTATVEVYTTGGTDTQVNAAKTYTYRKVAAEAATREAKDNELNERITNEANAIHDEIKAGDEKLDARITNVKEYLENQTVSKTDAAVQDGAIVKADKTIGENVTNLDAALAKETAARIGADKAQDAVIQQVNQNAANGIATLATAYNNEVASREAADNELNERITNEANAIHDTTNQLQNDLNTETAAREAGDTALDTRITNVKEYLENQTVSKTDAAVQDGAIVKADKTIGENVTNLDAALAKETAARIGADKAQDAVIQQVNQNAANGIATLATAYNNEVASREAADNELNERITNEANAIHETTNKLQDDLNTETTAREAADTALDTRITNVKEYLEKQTSDNYVSKADAAVQDGAIVKADKTIGENVTNLDAALTKETAARIGADKAQDKVIEQVNQNMVDGFNTINKNMSDGFTALSQADANELAGRMAADTKLVEATNGGLSLDNDNVLQKTKTKISSTGEVTTSKEAATTLILNKGAANQVKIDSEGVTVGTSSTQMDAEGFTAGGHDYDAAGAALMSDGRIKGANGDFTVDTDGNVASGNVTSTGTVKGKTLTDGAGASMSGGTVTGTTLTDGKATISNGNIKTNGGFIQTGGGNVNTQGGEVRTNGGKVATSGGEINTGSGAIKTVGGDILTAGGKLNTSGGDIVAGTGDISGQNITATGAIQGKSISDGTATMQNGNLTGVKNLSAETITTSGDATIGGDLTVKGKLNVDEIDLTKSGIVDGNNVTASTKVAAGEITGYKKATSTKDGSEKESAIDYDENGTSTWAIATDADKKWNKSTLTVEGSDVTSKVIDSDKNSNISTQTASESNSTITGTADGKNYKSYITQNLKNILQKIEDGDGHVLTSTEQTETGITNTAANGTITNDAKALVNKASDSITSQIGDGSAVKSVMDANGIANTATGGTISNSAANISNTTTGNMTNTVGGNLIDTIMGTSTTTVTGKVTEDYKSDLSTKVGGDETHAVTGNQTTTVSGNRTVNVKGTETENFNALVTSIKTDQKTSVGGNQTNIVGGDQQNTVSGSKTETVKGSVTEKYGSQVTTVDGDQSTHVGGNQSNVVAGNQTNTISGSKTESVKGAVTETYGSQTTKVNGNQSNTVKGTLTETVTGDVTEDYKANLSTTVGGNQTTTVTGDSSLSAKNITNTATEKLSNSAAEIENSASESITDKVGKTTVTTTEGLTKLTNEDGTHTTEMDFADVLKDLGVRGNATVDGNTTLGTDGNDTLTVNSTSTFKEKVTMEKDLKVKSEVLVNEGDKNQVRINTNGITVGLNSTVVDSDGVYVGGHTFEAAKAGMDIDGKLKAADGKFQVDTEGNVSAVSYTVKDTNIKIDNTGINAGGTKVTGLAPADISHAGSTDAVSGGQLYETNTRVSGLETRMGTVETRVDKLDNKIDKVGANAAAMANLHPLEFDEDSKWNVAAAVGSSGSETASAVGVFYRPNENVMVNASAAMGTGENMFGGGVSLRLGHGGNKAKEAQMKAAAAENKELRAKVDDLTARMDALLSVLNPNMSKDFPDVPENHWAYEAVSRLAGNGIVEGYEDGKYHGERQMTRYEMAEIIYNALSKGAKAEKKLVEEFRPELQAMAAQKKA